MRFRIVIWVAAAVLSFLAGVIAARDVAQVTPTLAQHSPAMPHTYSLREQFGFHRMSPQKQPSRRFPLDAAFETICRGG